MRWIGALTILCAGAALVWYSYQVPDSFALTIIGITLFIFGLAAIFGQLERE